MIVGRIGKAAFHHVLAPLATLATGRTVGLLLQGCNQLGLHMPTNRAAALGLRALFSQRTLGTLSRILDLINFELFLGPILVED